MSPTATACASGLFLIAAGVRVNLASLVSAATWGGKCADPDPAAHLYLSALLGLRPDVADKTVIRTAEAATPQDHHRRRRARPAVHWRAALGSVYRTAQPCISRKAAPTWIRWRPVPDQPSSAVLLRGGQGGATRCRAHTFNWSTSTIAKFQKRAAPQAPVHHAGRMR